MGITAGIVGAVGSIASGAGQFFGAKSASAAQQKAADKATQFLMQNFNITRDNVQPFITGGQGAFNKLLALTGSGQGGNPLTSPLTTPFLPTTDQLAKTPGYKFILDQGLKAVQNSAAAKGLGASGEALAGGANYATGLAGTTYQNQFDNYLRQNQQIFNMLSGLSGFGITGSQILGQVGSGAATGAANAAIGAGSAQAAGLNAQGQGIGQAIQGLGALTPVFSSLIKDNKLQNQADSYASMIPFINSFNSTSYGGFPIGSSNY